MRADEEGSESGDSAPQSPRVAAAATVRRRQFDDEEDDGDVLDSWDAGEDSEAEREKQRKAAEAKAKADAEAAAAKKAKAERIAKNKAAKAKAEAEAEARALAELQANAAIAAETDSQRRARMAAAEKEADLDHAADLFGEVGIKSGRKAPTAGVAVPVGPKDSAGNTVNIGALSIFNPTTKAQFEQLRNTIGPLIVAHSKKPQYALFLQDFVKQLASELPSDQVKKVASSLTTLSNEKLKAEKAAEKGGKKSKAAKTKTSLVTGRANQDIGTYDDDDYADDDFM
ncbi:translation initiation factor 3 subunit J [Geosmithia morbida]|uniref:Eukaryotic translation initiation factor 3 subunit J n=1 Tax=Geosmithia morbida TaxID=1094350 RepID=A0A9P4YX37_9HYPO|nr:translation initiation factor 3 subunit J [Geosmithia morbida]KAF4123326.1 translation initiation factor 3 subunit J [Geosmithia morbida]